MNTFYCFIATGEALARGVTFSMDDRLPQILGERYEPAKNYQSAIVAANEWEYPAFGAVDPEGKNIDWNSLWNAAYAHLVEKRGVSPAQAKAALDKTARHGIGTFVFISGKVTFGVPVEDAPARAKHGGFTIEKHALPDKRMPHMFQQGVQAPVVVTVRFTEAMPDEGELAAARSRTPAAQKLIGNTFVKKPQDVFGNFIGEPFFMMNNINHIEELRKEPYSIDALPIRDAATAQRKLEKRIPYAGSAIGFEQVQAFASMMAEAVKEANAAATGVPQPAGFYNCFTTTEYKAEQVAEDITRMEASEYVIFAQATMAGGFLYRCYEFKFSFHSIRVGKAFAPVHLLPRFV